MLGDYMLVHAVPRKSDSRSRFTTATFFATVAAVFWVGATVQAQQAGDSLKQAMGEQRFIAAGLHKLTEEELLQLMVSITELNTNKMLYDANAAGQLNNVKGIDELEGGSVVAKNGTFLGRITKNKFGHESLSNQFGIHGNKFSGTSLLNKFSVYGNKFSPTSAFNPLASDPPRVIDKTGTFVGYLTTNPSKQPRIDPFAFMTWLGRSQ